MRTTLLATLCITAGCSGAAFAQSDPELAQLLANQNTRSAVVAKIVATRNDKVPLLLSWTQMPPEGIDEYSLYIGLADVFGEMKTKEAIPFLIKNLTYLSRTSPIDFAPWLKTPKVIEETFPAIAALIRIGPDASHALIQASKGPMKPADRLAAIFVISQTRDIPEAQAFLASAIGHANMERSWAEEGLKSLNSSH